jgi:hypothetical protein
MAAAHRHGKQQQHLESGNEKAIMAKIAWRHGVAAGASALSG